MISLNDYLYHGDTVLKILHNYENDLRIQSESDDVWSRIDEIHADYLRGIIDVLEHNDVISSQSHRIRGFYKYMSENYPHLAFTFKGRIKSLIRSEEKFNRNLIEAVEKLYDKDCDYSKEENRIFLEEKLAQKVTDVRDLIAYRIIVSLPKCHAPEGKAAKETELEALYEIASKLPDFMMKQNIRPEKVAYADQYPSHQIPVFIRKYYKDFIEYPTNSGYQSLHIGFYDMYAKCRFEMQLRTKQMDDYAEIGQANHKQYEELQEKKQKDRVVPKGTFQFYDEAYEKLRLLQELDLSKVDVNMFAAANNILINDICGLFRGRLIHPYEHLSSMQNDLID